MLIYFQIHPVMVLWYIKLTYVPRSTTTNFISLVTACYMFRPYWPPWGI